MCFWMIPQLWPLQKDIMIITWLTLPPLPIGVQGEFNRMKPILSQLPQVTVTSPTMNMMRDHKQSLQLFFAPSVCSQ